MSFSSKPLLDGPKEDRQEFIKLDKQVTLLESKFLVFSKELMKLTDQIVSVLNVKFVTRGEYFLLFLFNKV